MAVAMTCAAECRMRSSSVIFARSSSVLRSGLGCAGGCWFSSGIIVRQVNCQGNPSRAETRALLNRIPAHSLRWDGHLDVHRVIAGELEFFGITVVLPNPR